MEIIATGELKEFFIKNLPKFKDPIILISSKYYPGCSMCGSSTSVYYVNLIERSSLSDKNYLIKVEKHKFPVDIYFQNDSQKNPPKKFVIGTKRADLMDKNTDNLEIIIQRLIE